MRALKPSIYKYGNGWAGALSIGKDENGKRRRIVKYAPTEPEIVSIMNTIVYEIEHGEYVEANKDTLIEYLKEYHKICSGCNAWENSSKHVYNSKWEQTTSELYKMYIDVHFKPYFKEIKLVDVKPMTLDKFYNFKLTTNRERDGKECKPLSINTVIKLNKFLKAAFNYAVINGLIKKNPTIGVKLGSKLEYKPYVYTQEQFLLLLDHVYNTDDEIPIILGAGCGLRRGEIFGLRWKDIDFKENTITIEKTAVRFRKNIDKDKAKNTTSQRTISAPDYVMQTLKRYRGNVISLKSDSKIITRWKPGTYSERFGKLLDDFNMPHIRLHDLRHYNAVIMMQNGTPDKVAAERLGHSNVSTLRNVYQHVLKDTDKLASENINIMFKKNG